MVSTGTLPKLATFTDTYSPKSYPIHCSIPLPAGIIIGCRRRNKSERSYGRGQRFGGKHYVKRANNLEKIVVWPRPVKDCGDDLIVNEGTQTNVCKAQRVTVSREREVDDVGGKRRKEGSRKIVREKPFLDGLGLVQAARHLEDTP